MKFVLRKNLFTTNGTEHFRFWFELVAANGEIVMTSETYTRKESAIDTMAAINEAFQEVIKTPEVGGAGIGCMITDDQT